MRHSTGRAITGGWNLRTTGYIAANYAFVAQPTVIRVTARGVKASNGWPRMTVRVGSTVIGRVSVSSNTWRNYSFRLTPSAGTQQVRISFDNDVGARSLIVDKVVISCQ
jgi:hypothetical protein